MHLESINLNKTDLDTKGVAFEQFMDGFFKGDFGQRQLRQQAEAEWEAAKTRFERKLLGEEE